MALSVNNHATRAYGSNSTAMPILMPRQKFNFLLALTLADEQETIQFERVQNVQLPSYTFDTAVVNQYNNKRVVQTKMNYDACQVTFMDTFDSAFHGIFKRYMRHYYHDNKGIDVKNRPANSVLNDNIDITAGYTLPSEANRYFFPEITITQFGYNNGTDDASATRITTMQNCLVTSVSGDTLDYSSSDPVMYTVSFQPESVVVLDQTNDAGS